MLSRVHRLFSLQLCNLCIDASGLKPTGRPYCYLSLKVRLSPRNLPLSLLSACAVCSDRSSNAMELLQLLHEYLPTVLMSTLLLGLYCYYTSQSKLLDLPKLPGPPGLPLVGNMLQIDPPNLHKVWTAWYATLVLRFCTFTRCTSLTTVNGAFCTLFFLVINAKHQLNHSCATHPSQAPAAYVPRKTLSRAGQISMEACTR